MRVTVASSRNIRHTVHMTRSVSRTRRARGTSRLWTALLAVTALVAGLGIPAITAPAPAEASVTSVSSGGAVDSSIVQTSLVGFNAGNIISDAVFTNKKTLSEAQIQTFLNSKVGTCQSGYVCLKNLKVATQSKSADAYCSGYSGAANETAARIIYRVAQACNINPQVLIVMLQKEQGLVTHTWPSSYRYNAAMGQACPDTAPCDTAYAGFFAQVYGAARQMQIYLEGKWFQWYKAGKTWQIQYHPDRTRCGTGPVYIANKATEALYYYTPYQPNASALRAGYGEGDSCGSYGNRNFYNYFTDWFGSTQSSPPGPAGPALSSIDMTSFVITSDAQGDIWGYPYLNGAWGARAKIGSGIAGAKKLFGVGDLDGNGHRDFVAIMSTGPALLLKGNGSGTLSAPIALGGDWSGVVLATPAGDFNGDGVPDLFTTDAAGRLLLWAGNDRGGFAPPRAVGNGWGMMNLITGNGDFDGDGRADLVARDTKGRLYLYSGDGGGSWRGSKQIGMGWSSFADVFNSGDFTGDGHPDLLAEEPGGTLRLYRGSAGGALSDGRAIGAGWNILVTNAGAGAAVQQRRAMPGGAGNLDGIRGGSDIFALTNSGEMRIYGTTGDGNWGKVTRVGGAWNANDRVIPMGDFNGDGFADIGQIDSSGAFYLHPGVAGAGFGERVRIGAGWGGFSTIIGNFDFDGNRIPDVLAIDAAGNLLLYRGNGSGGWAAASGITIGQNWWGFVNLFSVGDFDGDGNPDLIGRTSAGAMLVYPTTGDGNWGTSKSIGQGWGGMSRVFSSGDFNGDGFNDVLAAAANGNMYLYRGNGKGGWASGGSLIGNGWSIMKQIG
jgi:hypothetical protein